jgi:bifunctional non-homologous end joining protein LigD
MYAFDLLYLNGNDFHAVPLEDSKGRLLDLIRILASCLAKALRLMVRQSLRALEGIVSKREGSRYRSDRTNDWIKTTCRQRETLVIVGYALKEGRFDGLYLGRRDDHALLYAGKVDHGFLREQVTDLQERLRPLIRKSQPYTAKIAKPKAIWVKPKLLAEVEYRAKSAHGKLRHPSFKGLRDDLDGT